MDREEDVSNYVRGLDQQNSPIADHVADGNAFDFLPMWRWTWVSELWTDWEGAGIFDFGRKLMNATWGVLLEMLFMLSALLWEITSTVMYLTLDLNFWDGLVSTIGEQANNVLIGLGFADHTQAKVWAGIGALAFVLAAWRLFRDGASRAIRTILGTFIPLGIIAAMATASLSEQKAIADGVQGAEWGQEAGSPVWLLTTARNVSEELGDLLIDSGNQLVDGVRIDSSTYCDSFVAALENNYRAARLHKDPDLDRSKLEVPVQMSRLWIATHMTTYGEAQFGEGATGRRGACLWMERQTQNPHNTLAIWDTTCYGTRYSGTYDSARGIWEPRPFAGGPFTNTADDQNAWSEMRPLFACDSSRAYNELSEASARAVFNPPKIRSDESNKRAFLTLTSLCDYSDPRGAWNDYKENPSIHHPRTMQHYLAASGAGATTVIGTGQGGWQQEQNNHVFSDAATQRQPKDHSVQYVVRYANQHSSDPDYGGHWAWINSDYRNFGGLDDKKQDSEYLSGGVCAAFLAGGGSGAGTKTDRLPQFGGDVTGAVDELSVGAGLSAFVHDRANFDLSSVSEWEEDALGAAFRGQTEDFDNTWGLLAYPTGEELERAIDGMERLHGRNSAIGRGILALMALITAAAYMFSLIGLSAGAVLSQFILAIIIILLPVILLVIAMPFTSTKQVAPRLLRLSFGALMAYGVFYLILTLVLVVTLVLADVVAAASDPGSWERMLGIALVPIVAIKSVAWLLKQVGLNITGFKGALAATSGMAMAAMAPTGLDRAQQYGRKMAHRGQGLLHERTGGGSRYGDLNMRAEPGLLGAAAGGAGAGTALGAMGGGGASGVRNFMGRNRGWDGDVGNDDGGGGGSGGSGGGGERGGVDLRGAVAGFGQSITKGRRQLAASKKWLKGKSAATSSFARRHRKKIKFAAYGMGLATGTAPVVLGAMVAGKAAYRVAVPRHTRMRRKEHLKREKRKRLDEKIQNLEASEEAADPTLREQRRNDELEDKYQEFAAKRQAKEEEDLYFKERDLQEGRGDQQKNGKQRRHEGRNQQEERSGDQQDFYDWQQEEQPQQRYEDEDWQEHSGRDDQGRDDQQDFIDITPQWTDSFQVDVTPQQADTPQAGEEGRGGQQRQSARAEDGEGVGHASGPGDGSSSDSSQSEQVGEREGDAQNLDTAAGTTSGQQNDDNRRRQVGDAASPLTGEQQPEGAGRRRESEGAPQGHRSRQAAREGHSEADGHEGGPDVSTPPSRRADIRREGEAGGGQQDTSDRQPDEVQPRQESADGQAHQAHGDPEGDTAQSVDGIPKGDPNPDSDGASTAQPRNESGLPRGGTESGGATPTAGGETQQRGSDLPRGDLDPGTDGPGRVARAQPHRESDLPRGDFDPGADGPERVARAQPRCDEYNEDWQPPKSQRASPPNPNAAQRDPEGRG